MPYYKRSRWTRGGIVALFTGAAVAVAVVGGCSALVYGELSEWSDNRDHDRACREYENRHNRPADDDRMYAIPKGNCPDGP